MAAVKFVPNVGKQYFMAQIMEASKVKVDGQATIHLFTTNVAIARTNVLTTYSASEASYGGYASQVMSGFSDGGIDANFYDSWSGPIITFQATSSSGLPQTIYGYYVVASDAATLLWVCYFAPVITLSASGDGFTIPPSLSGASIFDN